MDSNRTLNPGNTLLITWVNKTYKIEDWYLISIYIWDSGRWQVLYLPLFLLSIIFYLLIVCWLIFVLFLLCFFSFCFIFLLVLLSPFKFFLILCCICCFISYLCYCVYYQFISLSRVIRSARNMGKRPPVSFFVSSRHI